MPSRSLARTDLVSAVAIATLLLLSMGTSFRTGGHPGIVFGWTLFWGVVAALAGWRSRSWRWAIACPLILLALVFAWELVYGRESWASLYVMLLGVMFAVAAGVGALIGAWWGMRR